MMLCFALPASPQVGFSVGVQTANVSFSLSTYPNLVRVPGYPVVPAIFVLMCAYLLYSSIAYHGKHALLGLAVLAVGAIVMLIGGRKKS